MQRHDLIDTDGENKAIRSFLRFYLKPGISIGEMRDNMEGSGWDGCWPESIAAADWNSTLTKFEVQAWLRHLFALEDEPAPAPRDHEPGSHADLVDQRLARIRGSLLEASNTNRAVKVQPSDAAVLVEVMDGRLPAVTPAAVTPGAAELKPIALQLTCPECGAAHLDEGMWATRLRKTHQCQACKHEWRPYEYPTVGVAAQVDTDRIEAICRAFEDGVRHGVARDGETCDHEDPAQAAAFILGYNTAANPGTRIGALVEDCYLINWLADNFCAGTLDDFDQLTIKDSLKWEFLAPKGVQGGLREVLRAALERDVADAIDATN